jgi:hypothetical protein
LQGDTAKARAAYNDFFHALERSRPRHSYPEASQGGVCETAVTVTHDFVIPQADLDRAREIAMELKPRTVIDVGASPLAGTSSVPKSG